VPSPPIALVDSLYDKGLYSNHVITSSEEATGFEDFRVVDGRRDETRWRAVTANLLQTITVQCDRVRAANMLVIDRDRVADVIQLETSQDNFTTKQQVLNVTVPADSGGELEGPDGVLTNEGVWAIRFDLNAATYWRVTIPAMTGKTAALTGLALGFSIQLERSLAMPYVDRGSERFFSERQSTTGRIGRSRVVRRRSGALLVRANSDFEHVDKLRPWFEEFYRDLGQPAWFVLDPDTAEIDLMYVLQPSSGDWAFAFNAEVWPHPTAAIPFIENAPLE